MSISGKEILLDQIGVCHDDPSWIVPVEAALAGLTAVQAARRDTGATHSVWQIVNHLTFWNERWLDRFLNRPFSGEQVDNDSTFSDTAEFADDKTWEACVARLCAVLSEWREALADCDEGKLAAPIPDFVDGAQWWGAISNLAMHNAYHIGQIVHLRKHQGTWPSPAE